MLIKKLGHSCLLIEEQGVRILTDPGNFSTAQNKVSNIHIVLISHEHQDHFHIKSLKKVLENNPAAEIFTNKAVGRLLKKESIRFTPLEHGQKRVVSGILIEAFGEKHAEILPDPPLIANTGFFINEKLYFPGDAFYNPKREVEALALPVCAPWLKTSEVVAYALKVNPRIAFPIHDGMLKIQMAFHAIPERELKKADIKFVHLAIGKTISI